MTTSSPGADDSLAGQRVRLGAVIAGGDDGAEGLALRPEAVVLGLQVPGHVALGAACQAASHDEAHGLVRDRGRPPQDRDLRLVLDRAQQRDVLAHVAQPAAVHPAQPAVGGVAELGALVPETGALTEDPGRLAHAVREQGLGGDLAQLELRHLLVHLHPEARIGAEQSGVAADDQRRVVAAEAREIADVDGIRDEDPVDPEHVEKTAAAVEAVVHVCVLPAASFARASSASR